MTEDVADKRRKIHEEYRRRMNSGGHPKESPDLILALVRDFPKDLEPLYRATQHYWNIYDQMPEGDPDPLDLEMVCDEVIDALYEFYGMRGRADGSLKPRGPTHYGHSVDANPAPYCPRWKSIEIAVAAGRSA